MIAGGIEDNDDKICNELKKLKITNVFMKLKKKNPVLRQPAEMLVTFTGLSVPRGPRKSSNICCVGKTLLTTASLICMLSIKPTS